MNLRKSGYFLRAFRLSSRGAFCMKLHNEYTLVGLEAVLLQRLTVDAIEMLFLTDDPVVFGLILA